MQFHLRTGKFNVYQKAGGNLNNISSLRGSVLSFYFLQGKMVHNAITVILSWITAEEACIEDQVKSLSPK